MPKTDVMACPLCKSKAVPQTRRRMIARAVRGGFVPYLPQPERWVGWYEAIQDIIDTLPDSQFAPWQIPGLPKEMQTILVGKHYGSPTGTPDRCAVIRHKNEPSMTVTASDKIECRAFVIDGKNSGNFGNGPTCLNGEDRIFTIQASQAKGMPRAYDGVGRVVAMTPRALARFQSFFDTYILPESKTLAAKIIGNAVPPLGYQKIVEGLL